MRSFTIDKLPHWTPRSRVGPVGQLIPLPVTWKKRRKIRSGNNVNQAGKYFHRVALLVYQVLHPQMIVIKNSTSEASSSTAPQEPNAPGIAKLACEVITQLTPHILKTGERRSEDILVLDLFSFHAR